MVLIAGLGDHLEGNQSQGGRNFYRSDITVSEQLRVFRRMLLRTIDTFIEAPSIIVGVVNGNHDDIQRFQTTDASDGHATESTIAVAEAMALNPERYGHVNVFVPGKDQDHLVIEANGTNFVLIHGHQFSRGKAMEWWEKQTFNNHPAGAADILIHGHEHEFQISSRRDRLVICTPALESESTWFKQKQERHVLYEIFIGYFHLALNQKRFLGSSKHTVCRSALNTQRYLRSNSAIISSSVHINNSSSSHASARITPV
jgi:predicted phosphodiesterase